MAKGASHTLNTKSASQIHTESEVSLPSQTPVVHANSTSGNVNGQCVVRGILKDVNALKDEMKSLKRDILMINRSKQPSTPLSTCHICVACSDPTMHKESLQPLLGLSVTNVNKVLKVKIPQECLHAAISSAHLSSHSVYAWRNKSAVRPADGTALQRTEPLNIPSNMHDNLSIVTFNCRWLKNSLDYVRILMESGMDIIVLQEYWLWPFEVDMLASLNSNFMFTAVTDNRLNDTSDLARGCGGISILRKKNLNASPLHFNSDHMCGLSIDMSSTTDSPWYLSILGVYMPSFDQCQAVYSSYLESVEHRVVQLYHNPLIIVGDLNAHMDPSSESSSRGNLWNSLASHTPPLKANRVWALHRYRPV